MLHICDTSLGASPTGAQVLSDAGAQINDGTLANPDLSAVNFGQAGSYTVTVRGGDDGFAAPPATLTIDVVKAPVITLGQASVAYVIGSSPAASQILQAARVSASEGTPSLDLSGSVTGDQKVDFSQAGSYPVSVTDTYDGASAQPMTFDVDVIQQPVVTLRSSTIDVPIGSTLSSDQVLTDAGAAVSQGGVLAQARLSGVNFGASGSYKVSVAGSVDGIAAKPAKLTIKVLARPSVRLARRRLSYPVGAKVDAAKVLRASGAKVSDSGEASVNLSGVKFTRAGRYSVQITGAASGMAATPAAVDITVQPVVSVAHARIAFPVGTKLTAKAVLRAAGAKTSAGSVVTPSLSHVDLHEAGDYKLKLTSKANGVSSKPKTITIVVERKPSIKDARRSGGAAR